MRTEDPRAIHLADYQAPDFHIQTVRLDFALDPMRRASPRGWTSNARELAHRWFCLAKS